MTYIADLSVYNYYGYKTSESMYAVGWLDGAYKFSRGKVLEAFILRLKDFLEFPTCLTRGFHICNLPMVLAATYYPSFSDTKLEYFNKHQGDIIYPHGNGEIHVLGKFGEVYAAPTMIYHYITNFYYKPPQEFIDAVMNTPKGEENPYECGKLDINYISEGIQTPSTILYRRGQELFDEGDEEGGIAVIREALKLEPFNNDFKFEYGYMLLETHQNEAALAIFQEILPKIDDKYLAYGNITILLERLKQYEQALVYANAYFDNVEDRTGIEEVFITRGKIYLALHQKEAAIKDFKTALTVPEADEKMLSIAKAYLEKNSN